MNTPINVSSTNLHSEFTKLTTTLIDYTPTKNPIIDPDNLAEAVRVSHTIGLEDGEHPGIDEDSEKKILPSQSFMTGALETTLHTLGQHVEKAKKAAAEGRHLGGENSPQPKGESSWRYISPETIEFINKSLCRYGLIILILIGIASFEYYIGRRWIQEVFNTDDSISPKIAVAVPIIFGALGFLLATAVDYAWKTRGVIVFKVIVCVSILLLIFTLVNAGLALSGIVDVTGNANSSGGVSGGVIGAPKAGPPSPSETGEKIVKFSVYIGLNLLASTLVFLVHFIQLYRDRIRRHIEIARRKIADGIRSRLEQFCNLAQALIKARGEIIAAYISGARTTLDTRIADEWDSDSLLSDVSVPDWVGELKSYLETAEYPDIELPDL